MSYFYGFILIIFFSIFILKVDLSILPEVQNPFSIDGYLRFDQDTPSKIVKSSNTIPRTDHLKASNGNVRILLKVILGGGALFLASAANLYLLSVLHANYGGDTLHSISVNQLDMTLFSGFFFADFPYSSKLLIVLPLLFGFAYMLGELTDKLSSRASVFLSGGIIVTVWILFQGLIFCNSTSSFVTYRSVFAGILSFSTIPLIKAVYSTLTYLPQRFLYLKFGYVSVTVIMSQLFMGFINVTYITSSQGSGNFWLMNILFMPLTLIVLKIFALTVSDPLIVTENVDEKLNVINKEPSFPKNVFSQQFALILLGYALSLTQTSLIINFLQIFSKPHGVVTLDLVVTLISATAFVILFVYSLFKMHWKACMTICTLLSVVSYAVLAVLQIATHYLSLIFFIFIFSLGSTVFFITYILANTSYKNLGRVLGLSFGSVYLFPLGASLIVSQMEFTPFILQINLGMGVLILAIIALLNSSKHTKDSNIVEMCKLEDVKCEKHLQTHDLAEENETSL